MINAFLGNRIIVLFSLPILIALYHVIYFYNSESLLETNIYLGFWGNYLITTPWILQVLAGIVVGSNALIINTLFNSNEFYEKNTYICSLLYIVLMSFYSSFYQIDGILLSQLFLILGLFQLFKLRQNEDGRKAVFNVAFFAGIAASLHPPILGIVPILFFMIWIVRPVKLRESILLLLGFAIPLFYAWVFLYTTNAKFKLSLIPFEKSLKITDLDFYVSSSLLGLSLILSLLGLNVRLQKSSIRLKKILRIVLWYLLIGLSLGAFDILYLQQFVQFSFVMIAMSFFFPYAFLYNRFNIVAIGLFYCLFAYSMLKFFI